MTFVVLWDFADNPQFPVSEYLHACEVNPWFNPVVFARGLRSDSVRSVGTRSCVSGASPARPLAGHPSIRSTLAHCVMH